jgi:putative transposase
MDLVEDHADPAVSVVAACGALGVSRATLYRATCPVSPPTVRQRAPSPRRLGGDERQAICDVMHTPEFVDQPPMEVFATLLSRGVYLASIRTIYRVLAELGESNERRNQRLAHPYVKPSLTATAPNQVWTWDITKLATVHKGLFLHAYVIIDLFSRYVVGWMVAAKECKHLATQLFAETVARHDIEPGLTVHSDRGAAMKSDTLAQLLATLGVGQSFSRPHVSDDNAFSEAQFKTLKYQPDYPGLFTGELHARGWLAPFFGWHNDDHHHSGLALFTPAEVFFGRVAAVHSVRQEARNAAYARNPGRFPNGPPKAALPPPEVHINPLEALTVSVGDAEKAAAETLIVVNISSLHVDDPLPAIRSRIASDAAAKTPRRQTLAAATAVLPS